jgi:hypothetical protein
LDWQLGGTDSGTVADILIERQIPFAFVTGFAEIADARYRKIPLLNKPFATEILGRTIEALLRGREIAPTPIEPKAISDEAALPEIPKIDDEPYDGSPI